MPATSTRGVWPVVADLAGPAGVLRLAEYHGDVWRLLSVTRLVTRPDGKRRPLPSDRRAVVLDVAELPDLVRALREHGDAPRGAVTIERPSAAGCIGLVRTCARQGKRRGVRVDVLDVDGRRVISLGECRRFTLRRKGRVACVVLPAWAALAVADVLDAALQRTQDIA